MIIDAYAHMFHSSLVDRLNEIGGPRAKKKAADARSSAEHNPFMVDVGKRVEQLDRDCIDFQVITPPHNIYASIMPDDATIQLKIVQAINNGMAKLMEESKGRLIAGGTVPLTDFEQNGVKEMERTINNLGLKAISLPTNFQGKPIDTPELEPFWYKAAAMGVPVYIHPNDAAGHKDRGYEKEYDLMHNFGWPFETELILSRLVFSGIMERYPNLKIVSHHLGGGIPFFWGRINETYAPSAQQRGIGRVLPKPLYDYFSLFYYDTAVGDSSAAVKCAYDIFGADKLVFATDAPFGPTGGENRLKEYPGSVKAIGLTQTDNDKIFAGNIKKILKL